MFGNRDTAVNKNLIHGHSTNPNAVQYNERKFQGRELEFSPLGQDGNDADKTKDLQYEMKVLYEYGEQEYVFKSDGSKPQRYDNLVVSGGIGSDPRTQENYTLQAPPDDTGFGYT